MPICSARSSGPDATTMPLLVGLQASKPTLCQIELGPRRAGPLREALQRVGRYLRLLT
jgi:hypothetical protein